MPGLDNPDNPDSPEALLLAQAAATATLPLVAPPVTAWGLTAGDFAPAPTFTLTAGDAGVALLLLLTDGAKNIVDPTGLSILATLRLRGASADAVGAASGGQSPKIRVTPVIIIADPAIALGNQRVYLNVPVIHFAAADVGAPGTYLADLRYVDSAGASVTGTFTLKVLADNG